jgi:LPS sulfotransferase NodH
MKSVEIKTTEVARKFEEDPKPSHLKLFDRLACAPDDASGTQKAFLALCTPRCGSTLFSEALNNSERLGICEEWLNYDYFNAWCRVTNSEFDLKKYMTWVARKSIRGTGVFCLKLHIGQLVAMNQDFGLGIESMEFDHIVYLYRRDKIEQAVSLCKASITNQYRSYEEATNKCEMSRSGIAEALSNVVKFDEFARKYLMKYVNECYAYEDFQRLGDQATRPHHSYGDVLKALGKEPCFSYTAGNLRKQANSESDHAALDFEQYISLGDRE